MALIYHLPAGAESLELPPLVADVAGHDQTSETASATGFSWIAKRNNGLPVRSICAGFQYDSAGPVLLHELGHVLGLGHTTNPSGVMYPTELGVSKWTPAESAALRYLRSLCD